jgi:hypothetical protein
MGRGGTSLVGSIRRVRWVPLLVVLLWSQSCGGVAAATMTGRGRFAVFSVGASLAYFPCDARRLSQSCLSLARVANWWHGPAWAPAPFGELGLGVAGEVGVAGSWRSDDDDTVWQPRCSFFVCLCFVWVARLAVVACPMWSCSITILVHCLGFRPVPLQMNQSILFFFFK